MVSKAAYLSRFPYSRSEASTGNQFDRMQFVLAVCYTKSKCDIGTIALSFMVTNVHETYIASNVNCF